MRNKVVFVCIALLSVCFFPVTANAQKTLLRGVLLDSLTHEGEPFATIRITNKHKPDNPVAMTVTDMDGRFEQSLTGKGDFTILFSSVGKSNVNVPFTLKGDSVVNLDTLFISEDVKQLKNVEIVAQKPLIKMEVDKMSYSIADDADAKSNSLLDMLRKVPMVTVDGNDNITVNGSSNFKVFVDGKPSVMLSSNPSVVLKNMPATSVKNIEVITNPGAKYDAEGVGGVLNLITNKVSGTTNPMNGYNATLRGMANTKGIAGGIYASIQQGKLTMTVNGNIADSKIKNTKTEISREQFDSSGNSFMDNSQSGNTNFKIKMGNLNLGYEIDSMNLLSASFGLMGFGTNVNAFTQTNMSGGNYGTGFGYTGSSDSRGDRYSINGNIDFQHSFAGNKDRMLTLSYLVSSSPDKTNAYSLFDANEENSFLNLTDRYTDAHKNTLENTFQLDYSTPLGMGQTFDMGVKYIMRNNSSDSKYYINKEDAFEYVADNSLNYKHYNDIMAGYAEYSVKVNRWKFNGGLRYEYTWQDVEYKTGQGTDFKVKYGNLVPSANLSYKLNESQNYGLTYNMRISRPGIGFLNPYMDKSDPTSVSYGNTNLESEKAHNLSLVYNLATPAWIVNLTLRQSFCNNAIERYSFFKENLLNTTYDNIVENRQTGLNTFVNWNAGRQTRFTLNGSASYVDLNSMELGISNSGWQGNLMLGFQQTLPWNIRLSMNLISSTKQYNLQGWSTGFNAMMGSLSRTFLNNKLSVSLSGMTNLSGNGLELKSYAKGKEYINRSIVTLPLRNLGISISYTLGKQQSMKKTKRTISNSDVKDGNSQTESIGNMMIH